MMREDTDVESKQRGLDKDKVADMSCNSNTSLSSKFYSNTLSNVQ